jgi:hypothetical protein
MPSKPKSSTPLRMFRDLLITLIETLEEWARLETDDPVHLLETNNALYYAMRQTVLMLALLDVDDPQAEDAILSILNARRRWPTGNLQYPCGMLYFLLLALKDDLMD